MVHSVMKIVDLTHGIATAMPVFPGTEPPELVEVCTMEKHGFLERKLTMYSHTGTHIDAPAHLLPGGPTLDSLPVETFMGRACVYRHQTVEGSITINHLTQLVDQLRDADFLLIATGWDRYWGKPEYFAHFPVLEAGAAEWLTQFFLKGVGLDVISADSIDSTDFPVHIALLGKGMVIVENLKNLTTIPGKSCFFSCLPLSLPNADGSPVRAVAIIDGETLL